MTIYKILLLASLLVSACAAPAVKMSPVKTGLPTEQEERIVPAKAYLHFTQAQLKVQEGDIEGAIEEHKKAFFYDPDSPFLHTSMGHLYARKGLIEEAIKEGEKATSLDPSYLNARMLLGG